MNRRRFLSLTGLAGLGSLAPIRAATAQATPGLSPLEIRFGTSLGLSGPYGLQLFDYLQGFVTYIDEINFLGGVHNRRLTLLALDHGSEPDKAVRNTLTFFGESDVFALVAYGAVAPLQRVLPILARSYFRPEAQNPVLFGAWSAPEPLFVAPYESRIHSVRQSYQREMDVLGRYLEHSGDRRIGICHSLDGTGYAVRDGLVRAVADRRLELAAEAGCDGSDASVARAFEHLTREPLDRVVCAVSHGAVAEWLGLAADRAQAPPVALASTVAGEALLDLLERQGRSNPDLDLIQSRAVPTLHGDHPVAAEMRGLTQRRQTDRLDPWRPADAFQELPWTAAGLEGFLTAKQLVRALEQAGPDLDSSAFRRAWKNLHSGGSAAESPEDDAEPSNTDLDPREPNSPEDGVALDGVAADGVALDGAAPNEAVDPLALGITLARAGTDGRWREIPFFAISPDPPGDPTPSGPGVDASDSLPESEADTELP